MGWSPEVWHPDEIVVRSMKALFEPDYRFDEVNFDYPTLPQYAMYGLGKIVRALGYSETEILVSARVLSALLAGLTVLLTYAIARRAGGSVTVAGLSGLVLICVSEMEHNGRFAHNDTFLIFFTTLAVLCVIEYFNKQNKLWLYGSFLAVGLAASCKYIGGSLILLPLIVYGLGRWKNLRRDPLPGLETLFIGGILTFLGFAAGARQPEPGLLRQGGFYGGHPDPRQCIESSRCPVDPGTDGRSRQEIGNPNHSPAPAPRVIAIR